MASPRGCQKIEEEMKREIQIRNRREWGAEDRGRRAPRVHGSRHRERRTPEFEKRSLASCRSI